MRDSRNSFNISYSRVVDNDPSTYGSVTSIYNDKASSTNIVANNNWWSYNTL